MFTRLFKSTNKKAIEDLEGKLQIAFPQDYRQFLLSKNGGLLKKDDNNSFFIKEINENIIVNVLYGIDTGNKNSNIDQWTNFLKSDLLDKAIIIGDDVIQGLIVLVCEGEDQGVYYWDDSYNFEESSDSSNTYLISRTFADFYNKINE